MIQLAPKWALNYPEFWDAIKRINLLFIKLRYFFVFMLIVFLVVGEYILDFNLTTTQIFAIILSAIIIDGYNFLIYNVRKNVGSTPGQFNALHLSMIQSVLDLTALMILAYFTGLYESPLYMFFVFQLIIASMLLPGHVVYTIAVLISFIFSILSVLQFHGLIPAFLISGLYSQAPHYTVTNLVIFLGGFCSTMIISVLLANQIASTLYKRERQLKESLEQLSEAEIAKQKYIIGVVHEIKTPIAAVQSVLDIVINKFLGPISEPVEEKLLRARKRSVEAINLINNILRFSKLKLLNTTSNEEIYISEVVLNILEQQSEIIKSKNLNIDFNDSKDLKKPVKGDRVLLELALSNVIGNSIKYTDDNGSVEIIIRDSHEDIILEVCDNGIGIPQHDLDNIFQQFYRASNIKGKEYNGSGLGLSLVHEIIQRLHGSIKVQSPSKLTSEGRPGTCFYISLPYERKDESSLQEQFKIPLKEGM
ncbi:MAG: HAMP domain-containing sensor histidine kinase [bacterium]